MPDCSILFLMDGDGGVVQLVRVEPELHAGEALGLHERQVGVGVGAQDAELRLPVGSALALRLRGGGRGNRGQNSASREVHEIRSNCPRWLRSCPAMVSTTV